MASLIPRVMLVPSISEESGPALDYVLVRSPAPNILSTSTFFLVTLHEDNRIRLWNTNDGRCVMASQREMLVTKAVRLKAIKSHPGNILVIGQEKDVYVVNVYKMMIYKHFQYDIEGCVGCVFKDKHFVLCDQKGKIYIWQDESEPSPIKNVSTASLFELSPNNEEFEQFSYGLECTLGTEQENQENSCTKYLAFSFISKDQVYVVSNERLDVYLQQQCKTIFQFQEQVVYGKFVNVAERRMLIVITQALQLYLFDLMKATHEVKTAEKLNYRDMTLVDLNLIEECKFFDHRNESYHSLFADKEQARSEFVREVGDALATMMKDQSKGIVRFRYSRTEELLYTLVNVKGETMMVTWSFQTLMENLNYADRLSREYRLPMFCNSSSLFSQPIPNCPINFYSLVVKNIYNKHQFQFFFPDEKVLSSVIYTSMEHPSLIIGTNYGRIFMVPMFQETDEKTYQIILIDQHHRSPITKMFVAYDSSRKVKPASRGLSTFSGRGGGSLLENGGHLISTSEDGTISVTNLNSGEIHRQLLHFGPSDAERNADKFMNEVNENRQQRRRHSVTQCFTTRDFFYYSKVKSQSVYPYTTFGQVNRIIEVKNLSKLLEKVVNNQGTGGRRQVYTPNRQMEGEIEGGKRRSSHGESSSSFIEETQTHPTYACLTSDREVVLLQLSNLQSQMQRIHGLDSEAIGVYVNEELNQYYVLTEKLSIFVYNRNSLALERKSDFHYALNVLSINELLESLRKENECFRFLMGSNGTSSVQEYEFFERVLLKDTLLSGLGSHQVFDYLNLSLSKPLSYHPQQNIPSRQYTKILLNLLSLKHHLSQYHKKESAQKAVLRAINDAFFLSNELYKSDFSEEYYLKQSGVTCIESPQSSICGSRQHIVIANTKNMTKVMRRKLAKLRASRAGGGTIVQSGGAFKMDKMPNLHGDHSEVEANEEEEIKDKHSNNNVQRFATTVGPRQQQQRLSTYQKRGQSTANINHKLESETLSSHKWPTRLLSLVHPFNIDLGVDETLEKFLGLNLPFLDFRLGIQGIEESFSFFVSKEDEEFHSERNNISKQLRLLKLSRYKQHEQEGERREVLQESETVLNQILEYSETETEDPVRFFGSENWKYSSYVSTIVPSFFLTNMVSLVDLSQQDVTYLIQEWLYILQRINQQKTLFSNNSISMSVISKILLKKDANISSTARDIIMKPILYTLDLDHLKQHIDEWSQLILETYKRLKKDPAIRNAYSGAQHSSEGSSEVTSMGSKIAQGISNQLDKFGSGSTHHQQLSERRQISDYFGELEIRGLVNVSYFALYYMDQVDSTLQYRVSKVTTMLTNEFVRKYTTDKRFIHLLTLMLQVLSIWMKNPQGGNKQLVSEVIKLLLYIYNMEKAALNKENVITKVTGENFHLLKPMHPELYLKLSAARALLEIGEIYTYDFLQQIQEEATHLLQGSDYQQHVLEVLRLFVNAHGEHLESHLVPLTQILMRCLDPNELALRKNSHKAVSVILSQMVKLFPMVAFHHESQRLAVGTYEGPIAIFDVRTSAKWKILEGHSGNVTCLAFDSQGKKLVSYSSVDLTLRLWKVGNTGFFSTIMGDTSKSDNTITLPQIKNTQNPHMRQLWRRQQSVQQQEMRQNNNLLDEGAQGSATDQPQSARSTSSKRVNRCSVKFLAPKEKEVQLIREDGSTTKHKIVK